ncbi:MAG: AbrB/MazE/SpoVT family DNA-binding domain-containing protein [Methanobacteriaceae archaeon]|nr:AbrB/MazE/SpoVT family DNA-binding domain-containing protein [Methanobacteriaceae archaeon]
MLIIKHVDHQGRIVIPKKWREKNLKTHTVLLEIDDDKIILKSYQPGNIEELFDTVEVDLQSDLEDWKAVKRELLEIR